MSTWDARRKALRRTLTLPAYLCGMSAVAFGVIGLVWAYTYAFPMAFMPSGYAALTAKMDMVRRCDLGQVVFIGDSRVESGIIPARLPVDGFNLGIPTASPVDLRVLAGHIAACDRKPRQVVIAITAQHFGPVVEYFWPGILGYRCLSLSDILDISALARDLGDSETLEASPQPSMFSKPIRTIMYAIGFPSIHAASLVRARLFMRYHDNMAIYRETQRSRGYYEHPLRAFVEEPDRHEFTALPLQAYSFDRMLRSLTRSGIAVGLMVMPERQTTSSPLLSRQYGAYLEAEARAIPGVQIINARTPRWPGSFFADESHMNGAGARSFTDRLARCISDDVVQPACDLRTPSDSGS